MTRITALLVSIFYPLIVVLAVLLLASVQLRSSSGSAYDTWRLQYNSNRLLDAKYQKSLDSLQTQENDNLEDLAFTNLCLVDNFNSDGSLKDTVDQQVRDLVKSAKAAGKKSEAYTGTTRCLMREWTWLNFDKQSFEARKERLAKSVAGQQGLIAANNAQFNDLIRGRQDFLSLRELEGVQYASLIVLTPYDLLVLLLVMFMGALGGMVRLLREYGDRSKENPTDRDYLFVPLIGLVVAIGGYVLAKAGLLLLSSTRDEPSLGPFVIALVGIVSGLMAKEVIDAISRAGANLLNRKRAAASRQAGNHKEATGPDAGKMPIDMRHGAVP
jgi:hypothetical protein